MDDRPASLLCIDLQIDPARNLQPDPRSILGARRLLALGRDLGWAIAHTRLRRSGGSVASTNETWAEGMRPLLSEAAFDRHGRSITSSPSLMAMIETWRDRAVYVAAFDPISLLSCLVEHFDLGPRFILVEDVVSNEATCTHDACHAAAAALARRTTTIPAILGSPARVIRLPESLEHRPQAYSSSS